VTDIAIDILRQWSRLKG